MKSGSGPVEFVRIRSVSFQPTQDELSHEWEKYSMSDQSLWNLGSAGGGDYERIMICGMSAALPQVIQKTQMARVGPFIPPWNGWQESWLKAPLTGRVKL